MAVKSHNTYVAYSWESSYADGGSPFTIPFGPNLSFDASPSRNSERVTNLNERNAYTVVSKNYAGAWNAEFDLVNGWWARAVLGSAPVTSGSPNYVHTYKEANTVPSMAIEDAINLPTDRSRIIKGAKVQTARITAAVGEKARVSLTGVYADEEKTTTLQSSPPTDSDPPFTFVQGQLVQNGSTIAQVDSVEIEVNNNVDLEHALNSDKAIAAVEGPREYNVTCTVKVHDDEQLEKFFGGSGSPISTVTPYATLVLKFDNGQADTSQRTLQINLGSVYPDTYKNAHAPGEVEKEEINLIACYCGSITYQNAGSPAQ